MKSLKHAKYLSYAATFICLICMIPPALIGGMAKSVDWSNSSFPSEMGFNGTEFDPSMVLPICMAELVPYWLGIIGLASVRYARSHKKCFHYIPLH